MSQLWSWGLATAGLAGLYLAGSGRRVGWGIGLCAQALWVTYAVATRQWGFIATAVAYGAVYARNLVRSGSTPPATGGGRDAQGDHL